MENSKKGGISKIVIILICVVAALVLIGGVTFLISKSNNSKQEKVLNEEIQNIVSTKTINDEIKTKGKYAKVEKALKDYLKEYLDNANELNNLYKDALLKDSLTAENLKNDGPEFTKTKENIQKVKDTEQKVKTKLEEMVSEEYINSKADELKLGKHYTDIYKNTLNLKDDVSSLNNLIEKYDACVTSIENVLTFLTENKDSWEIQNNKVMFNKLNLLTNYNSLVTKVNTAQTQLKLFSTTSLKTK